ncbi:hypothetical protein MKZ38_002691 [Zalerion maritima]|uniref:NB-ARC domain-containing protein n=1 Tax=Zalerion maritima TaxID=339359 RepID=A0AAD5WS89_9PEZI|nr:hypothetical protein MKZ38_002691 [Zalerion maritima]
MRTYLKGYTVAPVEASSHCDQVGKVDAPSAGAADPAPGAPISAPDGVPSPTKKLGTGCNVLYSSASSDYAPIADIVFVHGLTGDAQETWTFHQGKGRCFWPEDLLMNEPYPLRVITFGYNADVARWLQPAGKNGLEDHGNDLLRDLTNLRSDTNESRTRPIVFIGHSLGGLVIEKALLTSRQLEHSSNNHNSKLIFASTRFVSLLSTPHRGSSKANIAYLIALLLRPFKGINLGILQTLKVKSGLEFTWLQTYVNAINARAKQPNPVTLQFYYEDTGFPIIGKIVARYSAVLDANYMTSQMQSLPGNHVEIAKMADTKDIKFQRVWGPIKIFLKGLPTRPLNETYDETVESTEGSSIPQHRLNNLIVITRTFVGRDVHLGEIHERLRTIKPSPGVPKILCLRGFGGAGKSWLALEYARKQFEDRYYEHVFWVDAASEDAVEAGLSEIGDLVADSRDLPADDADLGSRIRRARTFLSTCRLRWLLVFDNYDHIDSYDLGELIPNGEKGCILITTRDERVQMKANDWIHVRDMSSEDAEKLFIQRCTEKQYALTNEDLEKVRNLIDHVGRLPLAIDKLATVLAAHGQERWSVDQLIARRRNLLDEGAEWYRKLTGTASTGQLPGEAISVFATIELSFELLQKPGSFIYEKVIQQRDDRRVKIFRKPEEEKKRAMTTLRKKALHILTIASFLDRTYISQDLFDETVSVLRLDRENQKAMDVASRRQLFTIEQVIDALESFSLVDRYLISSTSPQSWIKQQNWTPRGIFLHPLVSEHGRMRLKSLDRVKAIVDAVLLLDFHLKCPHDDVMSSPYGEKRALISHLLALVEHERNYLDPAGSEYEETHEGDKVVDTQLGRGELLKPAIRFASFFQDMGYAGYAEQLYQQILDLHQDSPVSESDVRDAKEGLAIVRIWQDRYDEAYDLCLESLKGHTERERERDVFYAGGSAKRSRPPGGHAACKRLSTILHTIHKGTTWKPRISCKSSPVAVI